jgi:hypothetical protein
MNRYQVEITENVTYAVDVVAEDQEGAEDAARELFLDSDNPNQWFVRVDQRDYVAYEVTE